jgi:hypothetical protein
MSLPGSCANTLALAVDDHMANPGSGFEVDDLIAVSFVRSSHEHLARLLEAHAVPELQVGIRLLTRASRVDDLAPTAILYPRAADPYSGGRQLEHLAFEVVSPDSPSYAGHKAAKLLACGVRRIFTIDAERGQVIQWTRALGTGVPFLVGSSIEDPSFSAPLACDLLVRAAIADGPVTFVR